MKMEGSLIRRAKFGRSMSSISLPSIRLPSGAKFWKKRSANISEYDPTFRAIYLGNVLTSWAKGDGCADKPLATLWKNYTSTEKPNILMKVTVCASGLKAVTKEHGLTEYWANRITFCDADPDYPKVFCWIYRHEGRKMKQELRCHAVLCPSENKARLMCKRLRERLHQALVDFKKEKISRQNARLSLANSAYDNPSMPFRKILLQTGSANYRPPVERGKAAPKLKVIEEVIFEEDEDCDDDDILSTSTPTLTPTLATLERCNSEPIRELRHENLRQSYSDVSICNSETELLSSSTSTTLTNDVSSHRSFDTVSVATTLSTLVDESAVGNLVVISDNPRAEKVSVCRNVDCHDVVVVSTSPAVVSGDADDDSDDEDDDDDLVTDYLTKLRVDADSATASLSPESGRQFSRLSRSSRSSSASSSSRKTVEELDEEDDVAKLPEAAKARNPEEHQDTISDESGYSEDSSPSGKDDDHPTTAPPAVVVNVNNNNNNSAPDSPELTTTTTTVNGDDCDLSVKGVMITDFSTAERFRYLQRSRRNVQRARADFLQNKVTEFCINI